MHTHRNAAVLFDLDGVLVDSREPITTCINGTLAEHGLPHRPPASLERFIGPPLALVFSELTGQNVNSAIVGSLASRDVVYEEPEGPHKERDHRHPLRKLYQPRGDDGGHTQHGCPDLVPQAGGGG
jgi:phosphoglycolate phosphatase-like HAD superfamily hydrolase